MKNLNVNDKTINRVFGVGGYFFISYDDNGKYCTKRLDDFVDGDTKLVDRIINYYKQSISFYDIPKSCKECKFCNLDDDKIVYYCDLTKYTVCISVSDNHEIFERLKANRHATCIFNVFFEEGENNNV